MQRVRLKDIAQEAGVAVITVSKALRGYPDVAPETRAKILSIAQRFGYVPDASARSLRSKRSGLVGLIVPRITNPLLTGVVDGVLERLQAAGLNVFIVQSDNEPEREDRAIIECVSRRVEGMLIIPCGRPAVDVLAYKWLRERGIPTVIVGPGPVFCQSFPTVRADELEGMRIITEHLIKLGHQKIAFISGPSLWPGMQLRLEGYRRALMNAGIGVDDRLIIATGPTFENGRNTGLLLKDLLASGTTAIQAGNDLIATGVLMTLKEFGLHVPDDVSVSGFGDVWLAACTAVPLTTVRVPKFQLGIRAAENLMAQLAGEKVSNDILPVELVIRASTGPVKSHTQNTGV